MTRGLDMASEAAVQGVLNCRMPDISVETLKGCFHGASSLRLCLTGKSLDHVLVSSNLLADGAISFAPVRAEGSCTADAVESSRPAFVRTSHEATLFPDVALASKLDCCAAFFCVPLANSESDPQPSEPADFPTIARIGALLLGFSTQTDVTEEDLRAGLLLAQRVGERHNGELDSLVETVAQALRPGGHPRWGLAGGLLRPSDMFPRWHADDLAMDSDDETCGILDPAQYALLQSVNRWTLTFPDATVERAFDGWRSLRLARVDLAVLTTLLFYHSTAALPAPHSFSARALAPACGSLDWLPLVAVALALLAALTSFSQHWYVRRRDGIMAGLYTVLAGYHVLVMARRSSIVFIATLDQPSFCNSLLPCMQITWLAVLSLVLQVRAPWQGLLLAAAECTCALAMAVGAPGVVMCPAWQLRWACRAVCLLVQVVLPGTLLYRMELATRRAFCASPTGAALAWRY